MEPLPPPPSWFPVEDGPYRMAMLLTTITEREWFEFDTRYPAGMAERRRLLTQRRDDVFAALPGSEQACAETFRMIMDHLIATHSSWFSRAGQHLTNRLTGEVWDIGKHHPLELAGRLVRDDLCLVRDSPEGPRFTAAVLCFPSRWRLHEKLGLPLTGVHGPVPFYPERLARPVDRFFSALRPGRIASRLNWSLTDDAALFQPAGKWRSAADLSVTVDNAGDRLHWRVERQTLRRLPESNAVLFGIGVHSTLLRDAVTTPGAAARLAAAVRGLPEETAHYRSLGVFRTALLAWLDRRTG